MGGRAGELARELARRLASQGLLVLEHVHPESGRLHDAFVHAAGLEVLERTVVPTRFVPSKKEVSPFTLVGIQSEIL